MIQWEECSLNDATHVEINGEVHEIKSNGTRKIVKSGLPYVGGIYTCIDISFGESYWSEIAEELFPFLGIRCLRKKKREPIEFEAIVRLTAGGDLDLLGNIPEEVPLGTKFKCVEILEEN